MNEKILVVEDNPQSRMVTVMTLSPCGYSLLEAGDGEEALRVAERERPNLILIDLQIPKVSGLEVVKRLRETQWAGRVPIIAVTGLAMKGDREKAIDAGCDAYLAKPFSIHELRRLVKETLEQSGGKEA